MDELEVYVTNVTSNFEFTVQTFFQNAVLELSSSDKFCLLLTQVEISVNMLSNLTELETCKRLAEFVELGQQIARVIADEVIVLENSQLVIEHILFAIINSLKLCSLVSSYEKKKAFRNSYWSLTSLNQIAIFNLFGPMVFTSISSIVTLMAKE